MCVCVCVCVFGWFVGRVCVCASAYRLVGRLVCRLVGWWSVVCMCVCVRVRVQVHTGWSVGWLVGWLVGCMFVCAHLSMSCLSSLGIILALPPSRPPYPSHLISLWALSSPSRHGVLSDCCICCVCVCARACLCVCV